MKAAKSYETLAWSVEDGIATIEMTRPDELNTMTPVFWLEMPMVFADLEERADVRAAVIASSGKHFTAGLDLKTAAAELMPDPKMDVGRVREKLRRKILAMQETFSCIDRARFPVIAAIQGGCIGAGVDLVTACCMRYAAQDAFFTIQEINIAIVADVGTLQRIPHLLPQGIIRELAYTGRKMPADEARSLGFLNGVGRTAEDARVMAYDMARQIASKSPLAVSGIKHILNHGRGRSVEDGLNYVATWNAAMLLGQDLEKAAMAALMRRQPDFEDLSI